ncbi:hypothetical protein K4L44_04335 [Halosquirtibacter laminarini]|uniref:Uncharacterized protein n=1 Tax=Halosquirtibacter laminarini TaxID=3374600 RepID=A0AC61NHC6_9BACT|nr:hypothetical protein K4L44_04335 [Prolixibacteraceae bacterium]
MKSNFLRTSLFLLALLLSPGISYISCNAAILNIQNKNCKYTIVFPMGCDTIPVDTLNNRFGNGTVDAGFFDTSNNSYFDGEYIQYIFLPTTKTLNQFTFKQLADDFSRSVKIGETQKQTDSLSLVTTDFVVDDIKQCFFVSGKFITDIKEVDFNQVVIPTKFGLLKVIRYSKNSDEGNDAFTQEVIANTKIAENFKYSRPQSKKIGVWQLVIAFLIGLAVYFSTLYFPKIKNKVTAK